MTQEGQFSPPVSDNSTSSTQKTDPVVNEQKGIFGGNASEPKDTVIPDFGVPTKTQNNDIPHGSEVQIEDTTMPDFGMPHDSVETKDNSTDVFGGGFDDIKTNSTDEKNIVEDNTDIELDPIPDFGVSTPKETRPEPKHKLDEPIMEMKIEKNIEEKAKEPKKEVVKPEVKKEKIIPPTPKVETIEKTTNKEEKSELKMKFDKLFNLIKKIYKLKNITDESLFDIVGSDNDTIRLIYSFGLETDGIEVIVVKRKELNIKTNEEKEDLLEIEFDADEGGIQLYMNDDLLLDEKRDLVGNNKKKMQVIEKMDKFLFLVEEHTKKMEKEMEDKRKEENEKKEMMNTFKSF